VNSELISHAGASDFEAAVLARSRQQAVLVDFWAGWCAPCRQLAPVLEELVTRLDGALAVVKVDTDAEQELAARYAIRSLPTLMVFRHGEAVGQVVGAQPLAALERLVAPHLARASDDAVAAAHAALSAGDVDTAVAELERAHGIDATDYRVHFALAELYLGIGRIDETRALLAELPPNLQTGKDIEPLNARLSLADAVGGDLGDDELATRYRAAVRAAVAGDVDSAVEDLLAMLPRQRAWRDGAVRKTLVDIFNVLGADERVKGWRTRMARSLN
jgi:putative thioredoxin